MDLPTPTSASASPQGAPMTQPKLRDSCHNCAASKLKCSKHKPTCVRCAKRGKKCEYFATKRAGRKQNSRRSNTDPTAAGIQVFGASSSSNFTGQGTGNNIIVRPELIQLDLPQTNPHIQQHVDSDLLWGMLPSPDLDSSSALGGLMTNFDDILGTPIDFSVLPTPDDDKPVMSVDDFSLEINRLLGQTDTVLDPVNIHINDGAAIDANLVDTPATYSPRPTSSTSQTANPSFVKPEPKESVSSCPSIVDCGCLIHALGLLGRLFPMPPRRCTLPKRKKTQQGGGEGDAYQPLPTIDRVIADNADMVDAIVEMLNCPCSHDGYLLCIISLVVFKILGWYAAAAAAGRTAPGGTGAGDGSGDSSSARHPDATAGYRGGGRRYSEQVLSSPAVVGNYCIGGEEQGRMAAQLVLSELHRVQKLVNLLSQRLQAHAGRMGKMGNLQAGVGDTATSRADLGGKTAFPLSRTLLAQLEIDIRKSLRALSAEIVEGLRWD